MIVPPIKLAEVENSEGHQSETGALVDSDQSRLADLVTDQANDLVMKWHLLTDRNAEG